ncbi:probable guanine nucleotide exchange factor MCF2L2 isoform X4 [Castor canadensis]|uniref:Probable guanine nucleotide exchange factor MCF2L2 isoform X4 n=1 Tax=Castor canadensis TaxID=51338 RepID=A0AC58MZS3_CASCN
MRFWLRKEEMALEEMVQRLNAVSKHTGGRGQDGSPVITFPDYPAFSEIPDKEFQNVLTYLTSIPREEHIKEEKKRGKNSTIKPCSPKESKSLSQCVHVTSPQQQNDFPT